ncbi:CBS domain-containing protein (plasmid) [Paracoccus sp. Arc7-R13]|nr:CBS domain-containing protein [Paracoccus sp. Arc7-R13]
MSVSTARKGSRIVDRPEYASKFSPLTARRDTTVAVAVQAMKSKNYGCIVITNGSGQVEGIVTERDIMFKLVAENRDPQTVVLSDIMTSNIRMAKETDNVLDWLRIMSNERFRRLPVICVSIIFQKLFNFQTLAACQCESLYWSCQDNPSSLI